MELEQQVFFVCCTNLPHRLLHWVASIKQFIDGRLTTKSRSYILELHVICHYLYHLDAGSVIQVNDLKQDVDKKLKDPRPQNSFPITHTRATVQHGHLE